MYLLKKMLEGSSTLVFSPDPLSNDSKTRVLDCAIRDCISSLSIVCGNVSLFCKSYFICYIRLPVNLFSSLFIVFSWLADLIHHKKECKIHQAIQCSSN